MALRRQRIAQSLIHHLVNQGRIPLCVLFSLLICTSAITISQMPVASKTTKMFAEDTDVQRFINLKNEAFLDEDDNADSSVSLVDAASAAVDRLKDKIKQMTPPPSPGATSPGGSDGSTPINPTPAPTFSEDIVANIALLPVQEPPIDQSTCIVRIVYGVLGFDQGNYEDVFSSKSANNVQLIFDPEFDTTREDVQEHLAWVCEQLESSPLLPNVSNPVRECVMRDFKIWLEAQNMEFPVKRGHFPIVFARYWPSIPRTIPHRGTVLLSPGDVPRIMAYQVQVKSKVLKGSRGGGSWAKHRDFDQWQHEVERLNKRAEDIRVPGVQAFQSCGDWSLMQTEILAVSGIAVSVSVSAVFGVLSIYLFIGSFALACVSVLAMSGIVMLTFGMLALGGGELGLVEAVSLSMLVGLSVDYVIHIAESYVSNGMSTNVDASQTKPVDAHTSYVDRHTRASSALSHMGDTVFHSAVTTLLACAILVFSKSQILYQVGKIICMNIFSGCVVSLVFYIAMLSTFGPEDFKHIKSNTHFMVRVAFGGSFAVLLVVLYLIVDV